jgi:hypothetical protein
MTMTRYLRGAKRRRTTISMMPPVKPLVTYRFPCSIDSEPSVDRGTTLPVLGDLVAVPSDAANSTGTNVTTTTTTSSSDFLKCPFVEFADGVQSSKMLQSENTVAELQPYFIHADALAVEAWITPIFVAELAEDSIPVISVAESFSGENDDEPSIPTDCNGIQFSLSQLGNQLEIRYKDFYEYFPPSDDDYANELQVFGCRHLVVPNVVLRYQDLNHIVVLWKKAGAVFQVYVNGVNVVDVNLLGEGGISGTAMPYGLQSWDPTYTLQLFANAKEFSPLYPGLLHKVSLYNQDLLADDIATLYTEGLEDRKQEYIFDPTLPLTLLASPWNATLIQGEYAIIGLGGDYNVSTAFWDIMVEFLSLPQYGDLMTQDSLKVREVGERIAVDGGLSRAKMVYQQTQEDYFSVPKYSYNGTAIPHGEESFDYRLIAVNKDDSNQVFGRSEPVHQVMKIVHVNHQPSLEMPQEVELPAGGQPKEESKRPFAKLGKVVLHDELDYDIDRVRVDVWALNGSLTILSEEIRTLADFESCSHRPTSLLSSSVKWQCHGDGHKDTNMTFIATPSAASAILSDIQYNAFHWNQGDEITIRIFDGSGGSCLAEDEHMFGRYEPNSTLDDYGYESVKVDCFQVIQKIQVPALRRPLDSNLGGINGYLHSVFVDLKDWSWADAVSWGFFLLLIYFLYRMARCCGRCCNRCIRHKRTAAIHVADPAGSSTRTLDSYCLDIEDGLAPPTAVESAP